MVSTAPASTASSRSSDSEDAEEPGLLNYTAALCVKNTFLDFPAERAALVAEASAHRRARSAPPCRAGSDDAGDEESTEAPSSDTSSPLAGLLPGTEEARLPLLPSVASALHAAPPAPPALPPALPSPALHPQPSTPPPPLASPRWSLPASQPTVGVAAPAVLRLADVLRRPDLGSAELPTVGSEGHHAGRCRPCAFVWKEAGCGNGTECPFCHLCDAGERRRRKKERKAHWHGAVALPALALPMEPQNLIRGDVAPSPAV